MTKVFGDQIQPALRKHGQNRSSSKKVRYLNPVYDNCEQNAKALIQIAKNSSSFGNVCWESSTWNVTASETIRGHKQRELNLHFTQHRTGEQSGTLVGMPFGNSKGFSDLVKAIIRLRREIGGQVAANQIEVITAFRYLYQELADSEHDLCMITPSHFDGAARRVLERETEVSAYKRIEKLEEIARILSENGLVRVQLDWYCSMKVRPNAMRGIRLDIPEEQQSNRSKLPKDGILEAVASLYHTIPKDDYSDRVRILLISLLVITGFRIGELLCLPARRVETDSTTGARYIVYFPEKGAPPQKKYLATCGGDIASDIIDELIELTEKSRKMANWLHNHPGEIKIKGIDWSCETLSIQTVGKALGLSKGYSTFFRTRNIELLGEGKMLSVRSSDLLSALLADSYWQPVNVVKNSGESLFLKDALTCTFRNAFHSNKVTLTYAVAPISEQQVTDFVRSRGGRESIFQKFKILGPNGEALEVASHAFRHWLNDLLDRGGLSDNDQGVYFGRRTNKFNSAYQHMSPRERTLKARQDLKDGYLLGPVAKLIARQPVEKQDVLLQALVQAVHVVPGGACFHQFSQSPCPNHMACTDGCGSFHWNTNDEIALRELKFQESILQIAVETAKTEMAQDSWGADSWIGHNSRKLDQVKSCINDCNCAGKGQANG